jgi:hypothetical protein
MPPEFISSPARMKNGHGEQRKAVDAGDEVLRQQLRIPEVERPGHRRAGEHERQRHAQADAHERQHADDENDE